LPSYSYRVRRNPLTSTLHIGVERPAAPEPVEPEPVEPVIEEPADEPSYRDLQARAKELDIPANQTADELKAAIEAADG
jgi:cell division protein FtsN